MEFAADRLSCLRGTETRSSRTFPWLAVPSAPSTTRTPTTTCSGSSSSTLASDRLWRCCALVSSASEGTDRLIWQPDEAPSDPMAMPHDESRDALEQGGGLPGRRGSDTIDGTAGGKWRPIRISLARWWRAFCRGEIVSQASLTAMYDVLRQRRVGVASRLRARAVRRSRGEAYAGGRGAHGYELRLRLVGRVSDGRPDDRCSC